MHPAPISQTPTPNPPPLCPCGSPLDPETLHLIERFPNLLKNPLCPPCTAKAEAAALARRQADIAAAQTAQNLAHYHATIPPEMRDTDTNHPTFNRHLYLQISAWTPAHPWLGIIGGPGTSKTRSLSLLCRNLIHQGHRPTWITACDIQHLLAITRHGTEPEKREASRTLRNLRTTPILFLDDLGKNTWSPTYEATLFDIVDHRKTHYLPLNWSANNHPHQILASGELTTERGGPLMSRLPEASQIIYA